MKLYRSPALRKGTAILICGLLEELDSLIKQVEQWASGKDYDHATYYAIKAETIIEILEVHLHGSCGASCFDDLVWINGFGGCQKSDFYQRQHNITKFLKKKRLIPQNWKPDPYQIQ